MYQHSEQNIYCKPFCLHKTKKKFFVYAVYLVTFDHYNKNLLNLYKANFLLCIYLAEQCSSN